MGVASVQEVRVLVAVQDEATGTAFVVTDSVTEASAVMLPAVLGETVVVELGVVGTVSAGVASGKEAGISAAAAAVVVVKEALNMSMGCMTEGNQMLGAPGSPTNSSQILSPFFLLLMGTRDFEGIVGLDLPYPLVLGGIHLLGSLHMGEYNCSALDDNWRICESH